MTEGYLGRLGEYAYALLRIVAGFMFMLHGTQKLFGIPPGPATPSTAILNLAGAIERYRQRCAGGLFAESGALSLEEGGETIIPHSGQ